MDNSMDSKYLIGLVGDSIRNSAGYVILESLPSEEDACYPALDVLKKIEMILKNRIPCHKIFVSDFPIKYKLDLNKFLYLQSTIILRDYLGSVEEKHFFIRAKSFIFSEEDEVKSIYESITQIYHHANQKCSKIFSLLNVEEISKIADHLQYEDIASLFKINKFMYQHALMLIGSRSVDCNQFFHTLRFKHELNQELMELSVNYPTVNEFRRDDGLFDLSKLVNINAKCVFELVQHLHNHPYLLKFLSINPISLENINFPPSTILGGVNLRSESYFNILFRYGLVKRIEIDRCKTTEFLIEKNFSEKVIRKSLENPFDKIDKNSQLLGIACKKNSDIGIYKLLLEYRVDPNKPNALSKLVPLESLINNDYTSTDVVDLLIKNGADVNYASPIVKYRYCGANSIKEVTGSTPLMLACEKNNVDVDLISTLIECGADLHAKDSRGFQALHYAIESGNKFVAKELIKHGAKIDELSFNDLSPLHVAAYNGHLECAKMLIRRGAKIIHANAKSGTPLMQACISKQENVSILKLLIKQGDNIHAFGKYKEQALHWAASRGHSQIVKKLIKSGASVIQCDAEGNSPLFYACFAASENISVIKMLMKHHADIHSINTEGRQPLHTAVKNGKTEIVKKLIKWGAKINQPDIDGWTPLILACCRKIENLSLVKTLITSQADMNAKADNGSQALHFAAQAGHVGIVKALLKRGANVNHAGGSNYTPLMWACAGKSEHMPMIKFLLASGANVHAKGQTNGMHAVHLAAKYGYAHTLEALIRAGANPNVLDFNGDTPLHHAFGCLKPEQLPHIAAIQTLLKMGANPRIQNSSGKCVLDLAVHDQSLNLTPAQSEAVGHIREWYIQNISSELCPGFEKGN